MTGDDILEKIFYTGPIQHGTLNADDSRKMRSLAREHYVYLDKRNKLWRLTLEGRYRMGEDINSLAFDDENWRDF